MGWVYKDDNNLLIHTKERPLIANLDDLPMPARHLVDYRDYGENSDQKTQAMIFSSRGCPSKCSFCSGGLFGKKFRFRSAQNILDEMIFLYKTYQIQHFDFVDDAMTMNRTRVKQVCDKLIEYKLPFTWRIMTRIDTIDDEILTWLSDAKCNEIHLSEVILNNKT